MPDDTPTETTARTGVPAYDAVYAYIRRLGDYLPPDPVHRNAMIWRAVQAALDAGATRDTANPALPEPEQPSALTLTYRFPRGV